MSGPIPLITINLNPGEDILLHGINAWTKNNISVNTKLPNFVTTFDEQLLVAQ